ncbi:large conductance mechanosensitive channel protein MscL [Streptomyces sp. 549]|uniref:large conductance mechanosensitive channel protein MscL n=1 Tax=Streptomyces sp. 549 TaxID=3049076 RepID=UPI0024C41237|nr:large conductance mechanosensitive channel protein MscL [Streptomyces sp. 549]MDK1476562.1 large conductance mechanosensitive channel protein MscL [Streptomyces sp. 549]
MSEQKPGVLAGFKEFLMRGNVVELAVAVVIGAAFTKIVNAVVEGAINPVVGALGPKDLEKYQSCLKAPCQVSPASGEIEGIVVKWGVVLSASITFLITAAVVYFLMILPMNKYKARLDARKPVDNSEPDPTEVQLLIEIRDTLIAQRAAGQPATTTVGGQRGDSGSPQESRPTDLAK